MKRAIFPLLLVVTLSACGESAYEKQSESDNMPVSDSNTGYQTGTGTESVAAPNAANTKRTPVPLDSVRVDTTNDSNK